MIQNGVGERPSEIPIGLRDICEKIHQVAEDVRTLGRFGNKRSFTLVSNAARIMTSEQSERPFRVYQDFLYEIRRGRNGRSMATLCAASIGKTKAITLNQKDRTTLVRYIANNGSVLTSEPLALLAAQYNIPTAETQFRDKFQIGRPIGLALLPA
ncbi:hypothetical protein N7468_000743 [Penicillium chermesinum]|uniref:Uncharacterized protein n=1 Tax=Penicillium chermesinum TaxID=63820 RepID=A0A9W9TYP4_9EURO|nr:uncharacterized protein N7468_000743 [Penicillium chermesinum]KAJ5249292.1 hypothetical protein N7468_000743 [Penicillium chermesinum]KAJ6151380.1 hypothetical protein N7470_007974 [Penicillium chermesinum]